jgi:uncharacterized protein YjbI with pentapeptide repeats
MTEKPDPFDVAALERSLNDSATRVSTIWVSYLLFALYLLIATGTTTHRQLFLEEPLKLPALNIDLPLFWFFVLAPILFVLFHPYVLLQVLLLGRTAAAYNEIIDKAVDSAPENALMRQRLANTLFAQIFAGSPRERGTWLGWVLKAMAWITLALAPIYIIFAFQFVFLPYHSHFATWMHRLLLFWELAVASLLWPLVLDARRDFNWRRLLRRIERAAAAPFRLLFAGDRRCQEWRRIRPQAAAMAALISFVVIVVVSLLLVAFPGEPHLNLLTGNSPFAVRCDRWISRSFDSLVVRGVALVDNEKLDKIERASAAKGQRPSEGERTRSFRERDLSCGIFVAMNLRRADFAGAHMSRASFEEAELQGANLNAAGVQGANLRFAQLQEADLSNAQLQGADLSNAQLQGADLGSWAILRAALDEETHPGGPAHLEGADLSGASLQDAKLRFAHLEGADLHFAHLDGADLGSAQLQAANLNDAQLRATNLRSAQLQATNLSGARLAGADLSNAQLQGADLSGAGLQGANLQRSKLKLALLSNVNLWRAGVDRCSDARVTDPKFVPPEAIEKSIEDVVANISVRRKGDVRERLHDRLGAVQKDDFTAIETIWRDCATEAEKLAESDYIKQHTDFLRDLVCDATSNRKEIAEGIIKHRILDAIIKSQTSATPDRRNYSYRLARGLLGLWGQECGATKDLSDEAKLLLHRLASTPMPAN